MRGEKRPWAPGEAGSGSGGKGVSAIYRGCNTAQGVRYAADSAVANDAAGAKRGMTANPHNVNQLNPKADHDPILAVHTPTHCLIAPWAPADARGFRGKAAEQPAVEKSRLGSPAPGAPPVESTARSTALMAFVGDRER